MISNAAHCRSAQAISSWILNLSGFCYKCLGIDSGQHILLVMFFLFVFKVQRQPAVFKLLFY